MPESPTKKTKGKGGGRVEGGNAGVERGEGEGGGGGFGGRRHGGEEREGGGKRGGPVTL